MKQPLLIVTLFLGLCSMAYAQEEENTLSLSLEEARQYAVQHNKTLQNASLDVQIAEANRWQTISTMLPQVSASYDYSNMCGYEMEMMGMKIAMPPYGTLGMTASVALTGAQIVGLQMQKIALNMSEISLKKNEQDIRSSVTTIYMSILAMESTVDLLDQNLENLKKLHEMTAKAVTIGVAEQTSADQLLVQVATMQTSINSTKRSLEMLYNSLLLQLGCDVATKLQLTDKVENLLNIEATMDLLNTQFELENNYNYQLLSKNLELSKKQVLAEEVAFAPTISAFYQYSNKHYFSDEKTMDMTPPNVVGASVSIPLWKSWQRMSNIKEAKISYNKTANTLETSKDGLLVQDKQLRYNLTSAYETYQTQESNLDVTKRVFENISIKFEHGAASSMEVTNASTNLVAAQSSYINAMLQLITAKVELEVLLNK
ncbi:MAG: TolC family protein [Bacteroidales bacterium]|nr:TolC family protein [Bacteroidales bacterium]